MAEIKIEHVNITVSDAKKTAEWLVDLFGWKVRWHGQAMSGGYTYHVGTDDMYLAVYNRPVDTENDGNPRERIGRLNHVGIVVNDLEAIEKNAKNLGFKPFNHGDYEPGRRFYFYDDDGIEFEIVSYAPVPEKAKETVQSKMGEMAIAGMAYK